MCAELGNEDLGLTAPWVKADGLVGGLRWWTGCHVSTSGGMERAVINAAAIGEIHEPFNQIQCDLAGIQSGLERSPRHRVPRTRRLKQAYLK